MRHIILLASTIVTAATAAACSQEQQSPAPEARSQARPKPRPAGVAPEASPAEPAQAARGVQDPLALVRATYRQYESDEANPVPPEHAYSDRLLALIERDRREAAGGVGRLGFDYWIVGQDYRITDLRAEEEPVAANPDRRVIRASFQNMGMAETNRFEFIRVNGRWLIEEIRNERRAGQEGSGWVLSDLLSEPLNSRR